MIRFKDGVPETRLHPRVTSEVFPALDRSFKIYKIDPVITATSNGKHKVGSKHYTKPCQAVDVRSRNLPSEIDKRTVLSHLKVQLGNDYDTLYENPGSDNQHFHIELDPT